jgi:hypothetical protein
LVLNISSQASASATTSCESYPIYATIVTVSPATGVVTAGATTALPGLYGATYSSSAYLQAVLLPVGSSQFALLHENCAISGSSSAGYAEIASFDLANSTVTLGTPYVFESGWVAFLSAVTVDSGHIFVAYQGGGDIGFANLLTVAPGTSAPFSMLSAKTFSGVAKFHSLTPLGSDRFLDVYRGASSYTAARVMTVGALRTTFDIGSETTIGSSTEGIYAGGRQYLLDANNVFSVYSTGSSPNFTERAMILNVSASNAFTVTTRTALSSSPSSSSWSSGGPFGPGHFAISHDSGAAAISAAIPASIAVGAAATCPAAGCPQVGATLDSKHYLGYRINANNRLALSEVDVGCP